MQLTYAMNEFSKALTNLVEESITHAVTNEMSNAHLQINMLREHVHELTAKLFNVEITARDRIASLEEEIFQLKMGKKEQAQEKEQAQAQEQEKEQKQAQEKEQPKKKINSGDTFTFYPMDSSILPRNVVGMSFGQLYEMRTGRVYNSFEEWNDTLTIPGTIQVEPYVPQYNVKQISEDEWEEVSEDVSEDVSEEVSDEVSKEVTEEPEIHLQRGDIVRYYPSKTSDDHFTAVFLKNGGVKDVVRGDYYKSFQDWLHSCPTKGQLYVNSKRTL